MALYLVRHAHEVASEAGIHNGAMPTPLTPFGVEQIYEVGGWFSDQIDQGEIHLTATYTSPQFRSAFTLFGINLELDERTKGLPGYVRNGLRERDMGAITGMTDEETDEYAESRQLESLQTPSGVGIPLGVEYEENFPKTRRRAVRTVGRILIRQNKIGGDGLVVISGALGKQAIGAFSKPQIPWREAAVLPFRNCEVVRIDETGAAFVFVPTVQRTNSDIEYAAGIKEFFSDFPQGKEERAYLVRQGYARFKGQ